MSLLDGKHTVTVTPKVDSGERDRYNQPVMVDGTPVTVQCSVQPISTDERASVSGDRSGLDMTLRTVYRVIGKGDWPGGVTATVTWNGRPFNQLGEALIYSMSPRTGHYELLIQSKGAPV